ncbi:MAG: VWA-like domain-containing protein, partial [Bacteroidota bacterium]
NQFFKYGIQSVDVVMFDTQLKTKPLEVKKARRSLQITGRGGTDFNPVMKFLDENRDYDGVVIFTDGYAPAPRPPKNRRTKILWLFNSERSYRDGFPALKGMGKGAFLK